MGDFPVWLFIPKLATVCKEDWTILPLEAPPAVVPRNARDSAHPFNMNVINNNKKEE